MTVTEGGDSFEVETCDPKLPTTPRITVLIKCVKHSFSLCISQSLFLFISPHVSLSLPFIRSAWDYLLWETRVKLNHIQCHNESNVIMDKIINKTENPTK